MCPKAEGHGRDLFHILPCPSAFGHTIQNCPYSDLKDKCEECKTPGSFLKEGRHHANPLNYYDSHCPCCDECRNTDFVVDDEVYSQIVAVAELIQDAPLRPDSNGYRELQWHQRDIPTVYLEKIQEYLNRRDSGDESDDGLEY